MTDTPRPSLVTEPQQSDTAVLSDLIARLEKATGPDDDLDALIWLRIPKVVTSDPTPAYTASIDAALTLVPEDIPSWQIGSSDGVNYAFVDRRDSLCEYQHGATPAIALCIAALKAREASR